jgi:glucosamine kinase
MPFYLAIDAGGTSTRCLLADETRVLARASAGTVKLMRVSEAEATARLQAMLREVAAAASVSLGDIAQTCIGIAGIASESVRRWTDDTISAIVPGKLLILGDQEIALDAAFREGSGILIVAGTGNNCIGRSLSGKLYCAGGWGPILGDEGSGYWIGLEAIRAALRAHDRESAEAETSGTPSDSLLASLWQALRVNSLGELIALANLRAPSATDAPPDFAALAPVVAQAAAEGNGIAVSVLRRAGEELADLVILVARKMTDADPSTLDLRTADLDVAFTGSVLTHIAAVREAFAGHLAKAIPAARVHPTPVDPLEGALYRARRS